MKLGLPRKIPRNKARLYALTLKSDELAGKRGQRIIPGGLAVLNRLNTTK